jgi:leader peptidase (prepilin peptidase)/N-methyltransferase
VILFSLFLLGSIFGSFYNVCIYRLPKDLDLVNKKSACTSCQYLIPFYLNIPIVSYIYNLGKCKNCNSKISKSYLIVEILTAFIFVTAYQKHGLDLNLVSYIVFYSSLLIIFYTDLKEYLILDKITLPISFFGLVLAILDKSPFQTNLIEALIGGVIGYLTIYLIRFIFFKIRKVEGMGLGDAKLFLLIGIWLGIKSIYVILMTSALAGSIVGIFIIYRYKKSKNFQIPYGCFIVLSAALYPDYGSLIYNLI